MISDIIVGVILCCGSYCLMSCFLEASSLRCSLILVYLLSGYKISPIYLKVKEGRSRKGNIDSTLSVKD